MNELSIMIVNDDREINDMLGSYFAAQGYQVTSVERGKDVYDLCRENPPDLIILDDKLPDTDGYEVCKKLKKSRRTANIPIIFLTGIVERQKIIYGLELGASDYLTKPFDIQELRLKVQNAIRINRRSNLYHPTTKLPSGILIKEELSNLLRVDRNWTYAQIGIDNFWAFNDKYDYSASSDVLLFVSQLIDELVEELGTSDDFIGHASNDVFILVTYSGIALKMIIQLRENFNSMITAYYKLEDQQSKGIRMPNGMIVPLMRLSIGSVTGNGNSFTNLENIRETANNALLLDRYSNLPNSSLGATIKELEDSLLKSIDFAKFRALIGEYFSLNELSLLCFDLNIEYQELPGETKGEKAKELLGYCKRHGKLSQLLDMCQELRPHVDWFA